MTDHTESEEHLAAAGRDTPDSGKAVVQNCLNCGSQAVKYFCAVCGQRARGLHIPLRVFAAESLVSLFRVDSRLWQTLIILVRRPGQLTLHYLQGKRVRYIGPLRLYFTVSFVVFFLLAISDRDVVRWETSDGEVDSTAVAEAATGLAEPDIPAAAGAVLGPGPADTTAAAEPASAADVDSLRSESGDDADSLGVAGPEDSGDPDNRLMQLLRRAEEDPDRLRRQFTRRLPWVFFFIMPAFACTLQLLYRRRESYYVPHLIFTLHFYAAGFLLYAAGQLVNMAFGLEDGTMFAFLGAFFYLFIALRRVYSEGRVRTIIKHMSLIIVHSVTAVVGVLLLLAYALLTF